MPALQAPLAASGTLVGDPERPARPSQQLARVRPAVSRWRSLWLYAQALGAAAPALEVAQLPDAQAWAGRPGAVIPSGTLSLIVHRPTAAAPQQGWAGLVIDEWNETVPAPVTRTSLSFRYQAPVAEAPQVVLLAVPPTADPAWDTEALVDTVRDTLTLAKVRAVDGSLLDGLRPFLPAIFLTGNTANEADLHQLPRLADPRPPAQAGLMASITYWNQLRPVPRAPSVAEGLAAQVRDPAWMLCRQWQLGEFQGADGGSPAFTTHRLAHRRAHHGPARAVGRSAGPRPVPGTAGRGRAAHPRPRHPRRARPDLRVTGAGRAPPAVPRRLPGRRGRPRRRPGRHPLPRRLRRPRHRRRRPLRRGQGGAAGRPAAARGPGTRRHRPGRGRHRGRRLHPVGGSHLGPGRHRRPGGLGRDPARLRRDRRGRPADPDRHPGHRGGPGLVRVRPHGREPGGGHCQRDQQRHSRARALPGDAQPALVGLRGEQDRLRRSLPRPARPGQAPVRRLPAAARRRLVPGPARRAPPARSAGSTRSP